MEANRDSIGVSDRRPVIGVLTWNGYQLAHDCLSSLRRLQDWPMPVVVIDNGSRGEEGKQLAEEFGSPVTFVRLAPNRGVPGGYNAAIEWAHRQGATHILLLNNDVIVTDPKMMRYLADAAAPDVAAVGPVIRNPDGTVYSAGGGISLRRGKSRHLSLADAPSQERPYQTSWVEGPCVLLSVAAACEIGGLANEYVTYWEETDWCIRAGRAGFRCLVEPRTSIVHIRGATIGGWNMRMMMLRNGLLFMRRNGTRAQIVTSLAYFMFRTTPGLMIRSLRPPTNLRHALAAWVRAVTWNVKDATSKRRWRIPADGPDICGNDSSS